MTEHIDWKGMEVAKDFLFKDCEMRGFKKLFDYEDTKSIRACFVSETGKTKIHLKIAPKNCTMTYEYVNGKEEKKTMRTDELVLIHGM